MDIVSKSVSHLKTPFFLCGPNVQEMDLLYLENLEVAPKPQMTPCFIAGLSGWERVEHESRPGGVFLKKLRWEDHWKIV